MTSRAILSAALALALTGCANMSPQQMDNTLSALETYQRSIQQQQMYNRAMYPPPPRPVNCQSRAPGNGVLYTTCQ